MTMFAKRHLVSMALACLTTACGESTIDFPNNPAEGGATAGSGGGGGGDVGSGGSGGDPLPEPPALTFAWYPCPWDTYGSSQDAECADVAVPLDWWQPDGETITLYLKRGGDIENPNAQQLWFLMGGPGGASNGYEGIGRLMFDNVAETAVYLLDHRGVGRSTRLGCAAENDSSIEGYQITTEEYPACIDELFATWGDRLQHFSTTGASLDLGNLIAQTRFAGQRVHVHGGSYGTYWAQRYLQLFPEQASAVSMLGVVNPTVFSFTRYDEQYEAAGAAFMQRCAADALCRSKLGDDPLATFGSIVNNIGALCPAALSAGLDRDTLRSYTSSFMLWGWDERVLPLALAYRVQRCDESDVTAISTFLANVTPPIASLFNDRLYSRLLGLNVSYGELYVDPHQTVEQADAYGAAALFAFGTAGRRIELAALWSPYDAAPYDRIFADASLPVLMIEGELDPASIYSEALGVGENFSGPNQHFVTIPGGSHNWTSPTNDGFGCALNVFANFLVDPYAPLLDCMGTVVPIDFGGSIDLASQMGTLDIWENSSANGAPNQAPSGKLMYAPGDVAPLL